MSEILIPVLSLFLNQNYSLCQEAIENRDHVCMSRVVLQSAGVLQPCSLLLLLQ